MERNNDTEIEVSFNVITFTIAFTEFYKIQLCCMEYKYESNTATILNYSNSIIVVQIYDLLL